MGILKLLTRAYLALGLSFLLINFTNAQDSFCSDGHLTFELLTGYVLTSTSEFMTMVPGTLQLTECIEQCRTNATCRAINFETGLCVLLTVNQQDIPLSVSQFPVFTLYAEKICLPKVRPEQCKMAWAFEKVSNYEFKNYERKSIKAETKEQCLQQCILEPDFQCRSVNYNNQTQMCSLSNLDRHSIPSASLRGVFTPADSNIAYYETNCIKEPSSLCDFKQIKGKMLKTVDSVYQNVSSIEECQDICLNSKYRCYSYDFGDPNDSKKVCRTSHLDSASLTHIEDPYINVKDSLTYQRQSCYNVTIACHAKEMIARIQTNKLFQGKIYAKTKPNSCMNDISDSLDFDLRINYNDLLCDVKQPSYGKFTSDIVIQHHDMIVTTKDLGLALNCNYDLSNRSISNVNTLNVNGDFENREEQHTIHSATVGAPNVTMKITDRNGNDITSAQVGDPLSLRFEFVEKNTPYQLFIRELVAVDNVDSAEIMLIDGHGCPVDSSIMSNIIQKETDSIYLEAPFDAFKFPSSEVVVFKALVTPCLSACEPAKCDVRTHDNMIKTLNSYGRRRRRSIAEDALDKNATSDNQEELIVMQTIKIIDSFHSNNTKKRNNRLDNLESWEWTTDNNECTNLFTIIIVCSLFLIGQLFIICIFAFIWNKRSNKSHLKRQLLNSDLHSLSNFTTVSNYSYDYSTGTLPRAQLVYSNPYNKTSSIQKQQSSNLRSNQVPNFLINKQMSKLNSNQFYNQESSLYNSNLFNSH